MPERTDGSSPPVLGYLSACERQPFGLFGGFLLLNLAGQPLEFHCTAPVKPSRIQQILYGPTLEPFLYGEQIGASLVKQSALSPLIVLVDQAALLAVRQHINVPTAYVMRLDINDGASQFECSAATIFGHYRLAVSPRYADDRPLLSARLATVDDHFDLVEPFGRIRAAFEEALLTSAKAA